jgi:hypothetical protein
MRYNPKLSPEDQARLVALQEQFEHCLKSDDYKAWIGDDHNHAPLPPKVLTARDIYKQVFGVDMPSNITATWEGSTVTFHARVEPVEIPVSFYFGASDE